MSLSLAEEVAQFYDDPEGFVRCCFEWPEGEGPDTWQEAHLKQIGEMVKARKFNGRDPVEPIRDATASGHGIGKSCEASFVFWWIMCTRPGAKGRVTANTYTQLETTTWAEIQKWHKKLICKDWFEVTNSHVRHTQDPRGWFAVPLTCAEENSQAFAGQHNRESTSFFIFDEASLIPDSVWDVADNGLTDGEPMWFVFGNPTRNTGKFYEACFGSWMHRWTQRSIDSRTCRIPNRAEHDKWIEDHGLDSDYCRVRILGKPPHQSEEQLISKELIESARHRNVVSLPDDPLIAGVDVPDGGSAWFVIRFRRGLDSRSGPTIPAPIRIPGSRVDRPTMIAKCAQVLRDEGRFRVSMMFIDSGFGAPIVERLRVLGFDNVVEVSFGGKSPDKHFANMRAYMWGKFMKEWLAKGAIDPEDKLLAVQLAGPGFHFKVGGDGAMVVESKDDMRKRGVTSPDEADALCLTGAMPVSVSSYGEQWHDEGVGLRRANPYR